MSTVLLRDVVSVRGGGTPRKSVSSYFGGDIPWVTPKDMKRPVIGSSEITLTPDGVKNSPAKVIPAGAVLVVVRSGVLKHTLPVALTNQPVTVNQDMKALVPSHRLDAAYLARLLKALQPRVLTWVRATTADNFPIDKLLDLEIKLPSVEQQRRIAAILDHADALRAKRRQALAHLDALNLSIFRDMFGDVRANERGWTAATVEDVAERVTDGEHKTPRRSDSGVPLLSARNVRDGWIDFDRTDFVDEEEFATLSRRIEPHPGDVLISCSGTIGRVAQVRERARFAMVRSAALVRPDASVHPTFLEQVLASPTLKAIMVSQANSSAQANLFQNQIKRLPIVIPPLDLQNEFARLVDAVSTERTAVVAAEAADDELFNSLQSRAFRGEL